MGIFSRLFSNKGSYIPEGRLTGLDLQTVKEGWEKIEQQAQLGKPSNLKQAVLEADKLTDFVLKKTYPSLSTMGERMKAAKPKFTGNYEIYDGLWFAHKVRNEMVHNLNFELPSVEASNILEKFKKALIHLNAL